MHNFILMILLLFLFATVTYGEEYAESNIRHLEEKPVNINLNDGNPMRIRSVNPPPIMIDLKPEEREQFEEDYGDAPTWPQSALPTRMGTLFEGNTLEDQEEAGGKLRPWNEERLRYQEDLADQRIIENLRSEAFWTEGGALIWERKMQASLHLDQLHQVPHDDMPWNAGVSNWHIGSKDWFKDYYAQKT